MKAYAGHISEKMTRHYIQVGDLAKRRYAENASDFTGMGQTGWTPKLPPAVAQSATPIVYEPGAVDLPSSFDEAVPGATMTPHRALAEAPRS